MLLCEILVDENSTFCGFAHQRVLGMAATFVATHQHSGSYRCGLCWRTAACKVWQIGGFWVGGLGSAVSTRNPQAANSLTKGGLVDARKDLRCSRRLLASAGNPSVVGASTALVRRLYWQFGEGRPQGCFFQSPRKLERLESYAIGPTGAVGLNGRLRVSSLQLLDSLPD